MSGQQSVLFDAQVILDEHKLPAEVRDVIVRLMRVHATSDVLLREQIQEFATSETANPWHRKCLTELFYSWRRWNDLYFDNELTVPLILIAEPSAPNVLGSCGTVSAFGGAHQIRIRPSLLTGTHPMFERDNYAGVKRAGRFEFVRDVLLHEMIHQWQHETDRSEPSYSGHGPHFRDKCNEIGSELALPRVRTCKKRGKDADLPSCSQWPHNVRPSGYYQEMEAA